MRARFFLPAFVAAAVGFTGPADNAPRDPRFVNIVAACNPSGNAHVEPQQIRIGFADNVVWRVTGPVASFSIGPKDAERWPFAGSISGNPETPASSSTPVSGARPGTYGYNVYIQCADGTSQTIDPDIIIGEDQ